MLIILGTADGDVSFSNGQYTASSIPDAKLYPLNSVRNAVWLGNHVEQIDRALLGFLKVQADAEGRSVP